MSSTAVAPSEQNQYPDLEVGSNSSEVDGRCYQRCSGKGCCALSFLAYAALTAVALYAIYHFTGLNGLYCASIGWGGASLLTISFVAVYLKCRKSENEESIDEAEQNPAIVEPNKEWQEFKNQYSLDIQTIKDQLQSLQGSNAFSLPGPHLARLEQEEKYTSSRRASQLHVDVPHTPVPDQAADEADSKFVASTPREMYSLLKTYALGPVAIFFEGLMNDYKGNGINENGITVSWKHIPYANAPVRKKGKSVQAHQLPTYEIILSAPITRIVLSHSQPYPMVYKQDTITRVQIDKENRKLILLKNPNGETGIKFRVKPPELGEGFLAEIAKKDPPDPFDCCVHELALLGKNKDDLKIVTSIYSNIHLWTSTKTPKDQPAKTRNFLECFPLTHNSIIFYQVQEKARETKLSKEKVITKHKEKEIEKNTYVKDGILWTKDEVDFPLFISNFVTLGKKQAQNFDLKAYFETVKKSDEKEGKEVDPDAVKMIDEISQRLGITL